MPQHLVDQPSAKPTRKVAAQAIVGALVALVASILNRNGVTVTADEVGYAIVILGGLAGYFVRERDAPAVGGT